MAKIIIIGGGVAGMSAAHELIERGFEVEIYEQNVLYAGGKARSVNVPGTNIQQPDAFLPGEHGFRFFPGFYQHLPDTLRRIPFKKNGKKQAGGVFANLAPSRRIMLARYGKESIIVNARFPRTIDGWRLMIHDLTGGMDTGLTHQEESFFAHRMFQLATSCTRRRDNDYEKVGWWEYMHADDFSDTYRNLLVIGLTRTLVAAQAKTASTKTGGNIVLQLVYSAIQPWVNPDRVLNAPTNDAWLNPWKEYLLKKGVTYFNDAKATAIEIQGTNIGNVKTTGVTVSMHDSDDALRKEINVTGDYYLFAIPIERMAALVTQQMEDCDPCFTYLKELAPSVSWMNGLQYFLNTEIPINEGHIIFSDTEWALTGISQVQFWGDYDFSKRYNGKVKGVLSIDISDWLHTKYKDVLAENCDPDTVEKYVWEQLEKSLNVEGKTIIDRSMIEFCYIDRDMKWDKQKRENVDREPLLVNTINSWQLRPTAPTGIDNMFLAADYVRTNTDLATMEGANEAARRAVNCIIDAEGNKSQYADIFQFTEPWLFSLMKWWDRKRYEKGLPYSEKFPLWIKIATFFLSILYFIEGAVKSLFFLLTLSNEAAFIISTMFCTLGVALLSAKFDWGPVSAFILAFGMFGLIASYAWRRQDTFLKKLLLFGMAAGLIELFTDNWLVNGIQSLIYPLSEPMLWASPLYMPFAWAVILIQVGYLGYLISKKHSMITTFALTFIIGMLFIPAFECFAKYASWWHYIPGPKMIFNTPYYIILGEGLICFVLPLIYNREWKMKKAGTILSGILMGIWIFTAYYLAYHITG